MRKRAFATGALPIGLALAFVGCAGPDEAPAAEGEPAAGEARSEEGEDTSTPPAERNEGDQGAPPVAASAPRALPSTHDYRADYPDLPDMGDANEYFRAHGRRTQIDRGYFRGDLHLTGAGLTKEGAGASESVIDGDVLLRGDQWVLRGLTITGDVTIRGANNDVSGCDIRGRIDVQGSGNTKPAGR